MNALALAIPAAAAIAIASAAFGAGMARVLWADDLQYAQQLHEIWQETETALQDTIASKDRTIVIQNETIAILKSRLHGPAQARSNCGI